MTNGRRWLVAMLLTAVLGGIVASVAVGSYWAGHRAGRGVACFETAIQVRDSLGRTLASTYLTKPGARSDYTFWGHACTLSIGFPTEQGWVGGRWAFDPGQGRLFSADEDGAMLFPASGRWPALGDAVNGGGHEGGGGSGKASANATRQ